MQTLKAQFKSQRGVTLIELLVVVIILGVIAAITIPMVISNQKDAYANTNLQNKQIINEALQRYAIDNGGTYPDQLDKLTQVINNKGPWLAEIPGLFNDNGEEKFNEWVDSTGDPLSDPIEEVFIPNVGFPK